MTKTRTGSARKLSIAQMVEIATDGRLPLRLTAYDGSATGPVDSPFTLDIKTPRGINYLATAPGDLGMARAYVSGEMDARGVHPGDPYDVLKVMEDLQLRRPSATQLTQIARSLGARHRESSGRVA